MPEPGGGATASAAPTNGKKILFGKYELGRLLGRGATAKVYHARHLSSGQSVALKILHTPSVLSSGLSSNVLREISALRRLRLRHPHVLRLLDVLASRSRIVLVLEFARGGELFSLLHRHGRLSEAQTLPVFRQLLSAVSFAHSRGVFHRDLKPENLLLDDSGNLKVSDFGLSAVSPNANSNNINLSKTVCGTPAYVAPEVLAKKPYDAAKVDLWSCGVILFVLAAGYLPFNDPNLIALYRKICRGELRFPKWTSPPLRHLISRLLDTDPETRITVDGVIDDPWFRGGLDRDQIEGIVRFRPETDDNKLDLDGDDGERDLTAFDIISFSSGFDLSGMFVENIAVKERFVSPDTVEAILEKVGKVADKEGLIVKRKGKTGRGFAAVEGRTGKLTVWVEVYRLNRDLTVVEAQLGAAAEGEEGGGHFWKEKLWPALRGPGAPQLPYSASSSEADSNSLHVST
ncbi:CBL-interacting serine/threonine-protein kinase 11-like [Typha angustifolia]|uniref:CBL-interacting serine/threonine-protein kinase 11-like n=1 Tax=Typha angustifolia TaxID=59011 RepID=UPI003C2E3177